MGRFYTTSQPQYVDYASQIPQLAIDSALFVDDAIAKNYDQLNLLGTTLQAFKDYRPKHEKAVKERVSYYNDKILDVTNKIIANPLDWKKQQNEIKTLQNEVLKDVTTPEGTLYKAKYFYDLYQSDMENTKEYSKRRGYDHESQRKINYAIAKDLEEYPENLTEDYGGMGNFNYFDRDARYKEIAEKVAKDSYTDISNFSDAFGVNFDSSITSTSNMKNLQKTILSIIQNDVNISDAIMEDVKLNFDGLKGKTNPETKKPYTDQERATLMANKDFERVMSTFGTTTTSKTNKAVYGRDAQGNRVIISGTPSVQNGDKIFTELTNKSTFKEYAGEVYKNANGEIVPATQFKFNPITNKYGFIIITPNKTINIESVIKEKRNLEKLSRNLKTDNITVDEKGAFKQIDPVNYVQEKTDLDNKIKEKEDLIKDIEEVTTKHLNDIRKSDDYDQYYKWYDDTYGGTK